MDLADRSRRDRNVVEFFEELVDRLAEFARD
jgi:hypothetical protein